jgi:hypothetical protein
MLAFSFVRRREAQDPNVLAVKYSWRAIRQAIYPSRYNAEGAGQIADAAHSVAESDRVREITGGVF